jgi:hypothetical protein
MRGRDGETMHWSPGTGLTLRVSWKPSPPAASIAILADRATTVPFTAVPYGPERTTTDNHEAASTCTVRRLAGHSSARTGFGSRGGVPGRVEK